MPAQRAAGVDLHAAQSAHPKLVEAVGHQAAIWSVGNRTFVLVAGEPRAEVESMSAFVHGALR
jgi:hypothetical protein